MPTTPSVCVADGKIALYYISNNLSEAAKADGEAMPPSEKWLNRNGKLFRNSQCIGVTIADQPEGPFIPQPGARGTARQPLV